MATFNRGRVVALFLCVLYAPNVSFAQDDWETVAVYMVDPIDEQLAPEVLEYLESIDKCNFTPAREAQMAQVARENAARIQAAKDYLRQDLWERGDGTSTWYPSWIPLAFAETTEDSLFKNILSLEGAMYDAGPRAGQRQTLREFFEQDGMEPDGLNADGTQRLRTCDDTRRRCSREFFSHFTGLIESHEASQHIISFAIQAKRFSASDFVEELTKDLVEESSEPSEPGTEVDYVVAFRWESIRLLQPAAMDPNPYVIDTPLYWQPAAKPVSSTETSSWGRIKATFAD